MSEATISRPSLAQRGGVWDYVSPSRLNLWLACPLKFRLKYIDRVTTPTSIALFLGKAVHHGLECFYRHRQLGVTLAACDVGTRMTEGWEQFASAEAMRFQSTGEERACRDQAILMVNTYLEQRPVCEPAPLAVEVALEAPLVDPLTQENLGIPLVGVLDLVLPDDEGPVIADFKTTARGGEPPPVIHEIQLSSYSYLFRRTSGEQEGSLEIRSLVKTRQPGIEFHRYPARHARHFERLFAVIRAYLDDLDRNRFLFRPGFGCAMCEFRNQCAADL